MGGLQKNFKLNDIQSLKLLDDEVFNPRITHNSSGSHDKNIKMEVANSYRIRP